MVDYSSYQNSVVIVASSSAATAPNALIRPDGDHVDNDAVWKTSAGDVDADGDFVYSVILTSGQSVYLASLRMDIANVAVVMLYVQCRERPGRWSVATAPVSARTSALE